MFGQGTIKGKVIDITNGESIIGASVVIEGTSIGGITDLDGGFSINVQQTLPFNIEVKFLGYESELITINSFKDKVSVKLKPSSFQLETVDIVGSRLTEKQRESPLTVESMDVLAIKESLLILLLNFYMR